MGRQDLDLLITGGQVLSSSGRRQLNVGIRDGRIVALLAPSELPAAGRVVEVDGACLLPGAIDTHTHIRDPARPDREDFTSGTSAASAGGFTTLLEMPTSEPPVNTAAVLRARAGKLKDKSLVDFCLYAGAGRDNIADIAALAKAGAIAFKTFMTSPTRGREEEFMGLWAADRGDLYRVMKEVSRTGVVHCLHCEDNELLAGVSAELDPGAERDGAYHAASRPIVVEDLAIATVLCLAGATSSRIQIVHASSPSGIALAARAKRAGVDVTVETAPHYLCLSENDLREFGPYAKCNPPLRPAAEVQMLWEAVAAGGVDMVGTDHCPYLESEVRTGLSDIALNPPGLPGLETALPLLFTAASRGLLTLEQLVQLTSENAAERFGLERKGRIAVGMDADIIVVDPTSTWNFEASRAFTRARRNMAVYDGREMTGRILATYVRGTPVYENGEIVAEPGIGVWIPGPAFDPLSPSGA